MTRKKQPARSTKRRRKSGKFWTAKRRRSAWSLLIIIALLAPLAWVAFIYKGGETGHYYLPENEIVGIDISHHQGEVDWPALKFRYRLDTKEIVSSQTQASGMRAVDFVIAKATEGATHVDGMYRSHLDSASARGIAFGAYHYFKPNVPYAAQAGNFLSVSALQPGNIVPVIDVEERGRLSAKQLREAVLGWLGEVGEHYGCVPIIYCNISYYEKYFSAPEFSKYPIWIAAYSRKSIDFDYVLWQQTESGYADGISGKVDIDVFNGDRYDFRELMIPINKMVK